ncbi:MAG: 16S rRNA (adenine(1518)-N(6)/adenine(1519)-N(6))-dimethyltransferase RsmA [Desulfobacterales bacterium]|nr:16S rRNA (adenine(1518)-N(6)/adenine(1519)-N(6))-dimethyltransferase RsmA [Desulfobacterales bacterium]MDD4071435.1 16S rRNA (adenine(1518)-N(6)/adenine(1519)-N(6))-dimethyltransferase RsmA [Desulfobacterales bacterium]MDD4392049.1 16S rRNA (adenine(1518)-N(6)/adenine(1519)-N(6))-dimethyltransferase RsmA [Desulfobacterales bacterium]
MTSPAALLNKWNIQAKKQYGQNFLSDSSIAQSIASRSGVGPKDVVLEIGAGLGALTIPLSKIAGKIYAIEKDPRIIPILQDELDSHHIDNIVLLNENILTVDIEHVAEDKNRKIVIVGNLPYNISSQILVRMIRSRHIIHHAVLMFQKELAQRIKATPGNRDYGRLSAMLQYCADIKTLTEVKASAFFPKPKIDSEVLYVQFKKEIPLPATDEDLLFKVIKAAFGQRRKTLKNSLAGSQLPMDAATAGSVLEQSGIDPSRRAETLSIDEFTVLSNNVVPYTTDSV